jgi:hypothetical protein
LESFRKLISVHTGRRRVYQFVNVLVCQRLVLRIVLTAPVRVGHAHARGACTRVHVDVRMCARTDANACMRVHTQRTHTQTHTHDRSVRAHICESDHEHSWEAAHSTHTHTPYQQISPSLPPFLTRAPSHPPRPSHPSPALPPPPLLYTPPPPLTNTPSADTLPRATILPRLLPPASNIFPPSPAPSPRPASSCPYSLLLLIHSRSRRRTLISWIPPPPWPRPVREGGRETERGRRERRERRAYTEHLH